MWLYVIIGISVVLVVLLCLALAVASFAFDNFADKLKKLDLKRNSYGITTFEYTDSINKRHFAGKLILGKAQQWQDHYSSGVVSLSEKTMASNSLASLAIVSHELGHAKQDVLGKLKKHWKLRRAGRYCGIFFLPLLLTGVVLSFLWVMDVLPEILFLILGLSLIVCALVIFGFAVVLKYKEIKIEKEASDFALDFLKEFLLEDEVSLCQEFLKSARLTYWASLIRTLLSWTMLTGKDKMFK